MADTPTLDFDVDDEEVSDSHTPDLSKFSSEDNDLDSMNEFTIFSNEQQHQTQQEEPNKPNFMNKFINKTNENEIPNKTTQDYSNSNTTNEHFYGKTIRNIIVEIFPECFSRNTEVLVPSNDDENFTINQLKTFLKNVSNHFLGEILFKNQRLNKQLFVYKIQLQKKEEYAKQIEDCKKTLKQGIKDIMKEIGEKQNDGNENIGLNEQLKNFINYCKNTLFQSQNTHSPANLIKENNSLNQEITESDESLIEDLNNQVEDQSPKIDKHNIVTNERKHGTQRSIHYDERIERVSKTSDEMGKLRKIIDGAKDEELKELRKKIADLMKEMDEKLNDKEKEIDEINVNNIKGCCEEEKVGEMIKTMTQRKLLTFTKELTKARHSSQISQQLLNNSSSSIIPITIFEYYNGCTKMITISINGKNVLKEVIIDKCDDQLIREIKGKVFIIEVQQHENIAYDNENKIAVFMIKRSEINQDIRIRHPCGTYFDKPKEGIDNLKYKGLDGTEIQIKIIEDEEFDKEMKKYYDILNGVQNQEHATLENIKEGIEKHDIVIKHQQKIPISRIHWSCMALKVYDGQQKIQIDHPRPGEERIINGKTVSFIQDDIDFIRLGNTDNIFDKLCVVDLTYCRDNIIDIHTPNGVLLCQSYIGKNGKIFGQDCGIGGCENNQYKKATYYISFVQSYVKDEMKNTFDFKYVPPKCSIFKTCLVVIPHNYNKDVYYFEYQNRREIFGSSSFNHIPIYFPIPVSRGEDYIVFFYKQEGWFSSDLIKFCVVFE